MSKIKHWASLKQKYGDDAHLHLEYRVHYENGGVGAWRKPGSNKFVDDKLNVLEWVQI